MKSRVTAFLSSSVCVPFAWMAGMLSHISGNSFCFQAGNEYAM